MEQMLVENLKNKWEPVLNCEGMAPIQDDYRRNVTAILLENQEKALREEANLAPTPASGAVNAQGRSFINTDGGFNTVGAFDPVLISLVRRSMPNLIAYDICGVQPMSGPTGLIFAMKAKYVPRSTDLDTFPLGGREALFDEAATKFSNNANDGATAGLGFPVFGGTGDPLGDRGAVGTSGSGFTAGGASGFDVDPGATLADLETSTFNEMGFVIDRQSVVAKTRALKAEYTSELAQDLKAVHGLDAEVELANILSTEILAEINREVIRTVYNNAKLGAQQADLRFKASDAPNHGGAVGNHGGLGGIYDVDADSDGRWSAEKFRGLMFQIDREANVIAKETRRGKGNFIICTSDVASALAMSGFLSLTPTPNINLEVDDTGNTFAGTLNGRIKVYIDPYSVSGSDYCVVGYRGSSPYDAGMFYCPYVPLQMVRAVSETSFQPKIGFKTRYGLVNNPFVSGDGANTDRSDPHGAGAMRANQYFRIFRILNLHGSDVTT
jgi:hypothetical protein